MVWRGRLKEKEEKIGGTLKKQWLMVQLPDYQKFHGKAEDVAALLASEQIASDEHMAKQIVSSTETNTVAIKM